jgi:hypothetical protein
MPQKDLLSLLLLVLAVVIGVQYARFHFQVEGVAKTVRALIPDFHDRGRKVYRERLLAELETMGLAVGEEDLELVEDAIRDEFRVVVRYSWPLHVLAWEKPREHEYRFTAPLYDF